MEIPYQELSKDALHNLITDFVSSVDDPGDCELSLKIDQVIDQLKKGSAMVTYDDVTQSCQIQKKG